MKIITALKHILKMEEFALNNNYNFDYWGMINDINWYNLSKYDNSNSANDEVARFLVDNYTLDEIVSLQNFVVEKREKLKNFILGYLKASPKEFRNKVNLSDDRLWDFCSHMVGLGEVMYNYVLDHPTIIVELQKDFLENFEYGFTAAVFEKQNY